MMPVGSEAFKAWNSAPERYLLKRSTLKKSSPLRFIPTNLNVDVLHSQVLKDTGGGSSRSQKRRQAHQKLGADTVYSPAKSADKRGSGKFGVESEEVATIATVTFGCSAAHALGHSHGGLRRHLPADPKERYKRYDVLGRWETMGLTARELAANSTMSSNGKSNGSPSGAPGQSNGKYNLRTTDEIPDEQSQDGIPNSLQNGAKSPSRPGSNRDSSRAVDSGAYRDSVRGGSSTGGSVGFHGYYGAPGSERWTIVGSRSSSMAGRNTLMPDNISSNGGSKLNVVGESQGDPTTTATSDTHDHELSSGNGADCADGADSSGVGSGVGAGAGAGAGVASSESVASLHDMRVEGRRLNGRPGESAEVDTDEGGRRSSRSPRRQSSDRHTSPPPPPAGTNVGASSGGAGERDLLKELGARSKADKVNFKCQDTCIFN